MFFTAALILRGGLKEGAPDQRSKRRPRKIHARKLRHGHLSMAVNDSQSMARAVGVASISGRKPEEILDMSKSAETSDADCRKVAIVKLLDRKRP